MINTEQQGIENEDQEDTAPVRMRIPKDIWRRFKALYPDQHSTHFIIRGLLKQHVEKAEARIASNEPAPVNPFIDTE